MNKFLRTSLICLLACNLFACSLFTMTGCQTKDSNISANASENNIESTETISFLTNFGLSYDSGLKLWTEVLEEQIGVDITIDLLSGTEYYYMLDFTLALGRASDVVTIAEGKLPLYASSGDLLDLTELVENSEILSQIPEEFLEASKVDDKLYGIPVEYGNGTITYIRQDILDELGLSHPTNYDEFLAMLRAIKAKYPNVIPYTAPGLVGNSAEYYLIDFYQDANPEIINVDGKWVDGLLEPNMILALERIRDAYAEGLIDVSIASNSTKVAREKFMTGQAAVFNYWAGNWNNTLQNNLTKNLGEKAICSPIKPIENVKYKVRPPVVLSITKRAENPQMIVEKLFEYMHDGSTGSLLFQHGVEGIHYDIINNKIVHKPLEGTDSVIQKAFMDPTLTFETITAYEYETNERIKNSLDILKTYGEQQYNVASSITYSAISSEITELKIKAISDIILEIATIEEALANYKAKAEALGMSKALAEMNS